VVREHLRTFVWELERRDEQRGAPLFVKREFQRFVRCGVLAHGFARSERARAYLGDAGVGRAGIWARARSERTNLLRSGRRVAVFWRWHTHDPLHGSLKAALDASGLPPTSVGSLASTDPGILRPSCDPRRVVFATRGDHPWTTRPCRFLRSASQHGSRDCLRSIQARHARARRDQAQGEGPHARGPSASDGF